MGLKIRTEHVEKIKADGEQAFPNECCGFLLGHQVDGSKEVVSLMLATNSSDSGEQYHRFLITPQDYLASEKQARALGLDVIGFYHSHPNAAARPSDYDRDHAWPWYSYIIVSVMQRSAKEVTSWTLQDDRGAFDPEEITLIES